TLIKQETYPDPKDPSKTRYRKYRQNQLSNVTMVLKPCGEEEKQHLLIRKIAGNQDAQLHLVQKISTMLFDLFGSRHSGLPRYRGRVTISGGDYDLKNDLILATPLAMMLEASIANTPLRGDIHVCATIDANGKLTTPPDFWEMLTPLRESSSGGRLIVTPECADLMVQLLVYGEPDFFTRWEVLTAGTLDEAMAAATQTTEGDLHEASQLFASIQQLANKSAVTKLAVNRAVRTRLANIINLAPNHLSSKILLIQGSGKRPMRLSKIALAHALLPVVQKMNQHLKQDVDPSAISGKDMKKYHDQARQDLDKLEQFMDRSKQGLYPEAEELANDFRRIAAMKRRASGDYEREDENAAKLGVFYRKMLRTSETLLAKTIAATSLTPKPENNQTNDH
ncbi:MAG: hypothetical protein KJO79_00150, partial [Verrucomicrobiae bacterium]|nr:hypothetical protein [Verrucomicrobiae bacterium]NNJ85556.1 hypothetical protein [Akkermansiaceae bacterium]